jgi:GTP cyclohydrolase IA
MFPLDRGSGVPYDGRGFPIPLDQGADIVTFPADPHERTNGILAGENGDPRQPAPEAPVDRPRIERAIREILLAVGEDPDREGLRETPSRVARMYAELFGGLHQDPRRHLRQFFSETCDEVVLVRDISFNSMCEHHLLPFMGTVHVAYLPGDRVIGLSKLARVVEEVARRPQVQERMTEQIANLLLDELRAKGVGVVIEAVHTCMTIRGVRKPGAVCVTSAMKGCFRTKASTRAELMTLIYGDRR